MDGPEVGGPRGVWKLKKGGQTSGAWGGNPYSLVMIRQGGLVVTGLLEEQEMHTVI